MVIDFPSVAVDAKAFSFIFVVSSLVDEDVPIKEVVQATSSFSIVDGLTIVDNSIWGSSVDVINLFIDVGNGSSDVMATEDNSGIGESVTGICLEMVKKIDLLKSLSPS